MALGVYPYITASIIMQLMTRSFRALMSCRTRARWPQQDQSVHSLADRSTSIAPSVTVRGVVLTADWSGRTALDRRIRRESETDPVDPRHFADHDRGTMLLVWMGELITEFGIGNGISIIIFGGIVASLPVP